MDYDCLEKVLFNKLRKNLLCTVSKGNGMGHAGVCLKKKSICDSSDYMNWFKK